MFSNALFPGSRRLPDDDPTIHPPLNDYAFRWVVIAIIGLISAVGLWTLNVTVVWESLWSPAQIDVLLAIFAMIYSVIGARAPRIGRSTAVVSDLLLSILQFMVAVNVLAPITYLAAAPGYPLADGALTKFDAMLFGFNWYVESNWVAGHPTFDWILQHAYRSVYYQGAFIFVLGSITRPGDRNGEIIWQFCIGIVLTSAVFVFTPALGHVAHIGTGWMEMLTTIRSGEWTTLDFSHLKGIVSFPSFHTTIAILLVYAVRRHPWALAALVPLNALVIVATLSVGGHYLADLPAGAAVAVVSIVATRFLRQQLAKRRLPAFIEPWRAAALGFSNRMVNVSAAPTGACLVKPSPQAAPD